MASDRNFNPHATFGLRIEGYCCCSYDIYEVTSDPECVYKNAEKEIRGGAYFRR